MTATNQALARGLISLCSTVRWRVDFAVQAPVHPGRLSPAGFGVFPPHEEVGWLTLVGRWAVAAADVIGIDEGSFLLDGNR
jgi:hypothetical protein